MQTTIYLRLKKYVHITPRQKIKVKDIAFLAGPKDIVTTCNELVIEQQIKTQNSVQVIEAFTIIKIIQSTIPNLDIQLLGLNQCFIYEHKKEAKSKFILVLAVWLLLFIGSAMAIMNFHYDVSMQSVQQRLHYIFTGEDKASPLWLQIPYSIGLGLGMILFFNYLFKKRFNDEPSPMEIEMHKYQQDIDQYNQYYENKLNQHANDESQY